MAGRVYEGYECVCERESEREREVKGRDREREGVREYVSEAG